jgi:hypothetical protein
VSLGAIDERTRARKVLDLRREQLPPKAALEPAPEPRTFDVVHVLEGTPPEPPAVLANDLLVDRDVNLWVGHGGTGKSVLGLSAAVAVATGRPVFGTLPVNRPGAVLLVLPEDGQAAARMMLDSIIDGLELDAQERALCGERIIMITDDSAVSLVHDAHRLGQTALANRVVLVVLDPIRNLLGGEPENDNDVAGVVQDALRREICRGAGAAVLEMMHNRKPSKDSLPDAGVSRHDARGASGWVDGARLVFSVAKKDGRLTLTAVKANRLRSDLRHELNLMIDTDPENKAAWRTCTITDANTGAASETLTAGRGRALNPNEQTVLSCLDDSHEPEKRASWSAWREGAGLNENTFRSVKKRLLDAGLVAALPTGRKHPNGGADYSYQITADGRMALQSGWAFQRFNGERVS